MGRFQAPGDAGRGSLQRTLDGWRERKGLCRVTQK